MAIDPANVSGRWVEVREEASPGQILLRPITADIPPARARRRLELGGGGQAQAGRPGPDDRYEMAAASGWQVDGDTLTIDAGEWQGKYRIVTADQDRLVLERA